MSVQYFGGCLILRGIAQPPQYWCYPSAVLMLSLCSTDAIPLQYWCYPPAVLMLSPCSTDAIPLQYWAVSAVLNRRYIYNFRKICKSTENLRKMILECFVKNNFSENCRRILGECLLHFRFYHLIKYLSTGLLVPYREIPNPWFLCTDLASSVRTSKSRT